MFIDIAYFILIVIACYKGLRKGFIIAVFSVLGFIIGIAAALKLSAVVAVKLAAHVGAAKWLPAVSFLIVFLAAAFIVNFVGKIIQKTFETVMLGWINRLAGVAIFVLLFSIIYSVFLFYAAQLHFLNAATISNSVVYPYLQPLAPKILNFIGSIIPWFKNMFSQLENFFTVRTNK